MQKELLCFDELALGDEYRDSSRGAVASLGTDGGFIERSPGVMNASSRDQHHPAAQ
jgi:hypothetical protein